MKLLIYTVVSKRFRFTFVGVTMIFISLLVLWFARGEDSAPILCRIFFILLFMSNF